MIDPNALAGVAYGVEGEQEMRTWRAVVTSADGNPVKLRKDPNTKTPTWAESRWAAW